MTVYVDDMKADFGRMKMCHMIADFDEELHQMADKIGVQRKWHQAPPKHDSHYDIALTKVALAIKYGAVPVTLKTLAMMSAVRRKTGFLPDPATARDEFTALLEKSSAYAALKAEMHVMEKSIEHLSTLPEPPDDRKLLPEKMILEDTTPPPRRLVGAARAYIKNGILDAEAFKIMEQLADALQWNAKACGHWGLGDDDL
jgi:hypothetical protein